MNDGSGTLAMGFREYDPATGQFLSNDPLGLAGGDTKSPTLRRQQPGDVHRPARPVWTVLRIRQHLRLRHSSRRGP